MTQQSVRARRTKKAALDHLFVPPDEIHEYMHEIYDRIARRAHELFESRGSVHGHDWEDWLQAQLEVLRPITFEMEDSGDAFVAVVLVDDYRPENLRIGLETQHLSICGLSTVKNNRSDAPSVGTQSEGFFAMSGLTNMDTFGGNSNANTKINSDDGCGFSLVHGNDYPSREGGRV